jgi:hypothetical protein
MSFENLKFLVDIWAGVDPGSEPVSEDRAEENFIGIDDCSWF